jgi:hypothetical protein
MSVITMETDKHNGCIIQSILSSHVMERMKNGYSDLFYHCVEVLNNYPDHISEEIFLQQYFSNHQVNACIQHFHACFQKLNISSIDRYLMKHSYQRFYSIVFDIRRYFEQSSIFSTKQMAFIFFDPKKTYTKVFVLPMRDNRCYYAR